MFLCVFMLSTHMLQLLVSDVLDHNVTYAHMAKIRPHTAVMTKLLRGAPQAPDRDFKLAVIIEEMH